MTKKRYKAIPSNLECSNGMEYMLVRRNDGFNVCQVCSKYTANEIVNELNNLYEENQKLNSDKNHLMGYLIKIKSFDDEDIDAIFEREAYGEWGKVYYYMKEESKKEQEYLQQLKRS